MSYNIIGFKFNSLISFKREGTSIKLRNCNIIVNNYYVSGVRAINSSEQPALLPIKGAIPLLLEQTGCLTDPSEHFFSIIEKTLHNHNIIDNLHSMSPPQWMRLDILTTHKSRLEGYTRDVLPNYDFSGLRGSRFIHLDFMARQIGNGFASYQINAIPNLIMSSSIKTHYIGSLKYKVERAIEDIKADGFEASVIITPYGNFDIPEQLGIPIVPILRTYDTLPFLMYKTKVFGLPVMTANSRDTNSIHVADLEQFLKIRYTPENMLEFIWFSHPKFDGDNLGLFIRMNYDVRIKHTKAARAIALK